MPDRDRGPLGDVVRRLRTERKLTQAELAERIGLSEPMVAHIEVGRRNASDRTLTGMVRAMGLSKGEESELRKAQELMRATEPRDSDLAARVTVVEEKLDRVLAAVDRLTRKRGGR